MNLRKSLRRYLALSPLQSTFRLLYRVALIGMNYGGAGSSRSSGDAQALELLRGAGPCVVFDVGANIGSYVAQVLEHLGDQATVYAFEPSSAAFARLREHVGDRKNVQLVQQGIGSVAGSSTLFSAVPGSVLASTYVNPLEKEALPGEPIEIVSIDEVCRARSIDHIDLLKLDLEGGELDALRGASGLLERGAIDLIQFEFGQPSIGARTFFIDLFDLLSPRYQIYRVLPHGLARLDAYHETLEVFMSTNYLAVSRQRASRFKLPG